MANRILEGILAATLAVTAGCNSLPRPSAEQYTALKKQVADVENVEASTHVDVGQAAYKFKTAAEAHAVASRKDGVQTPVEARGALELTLDGQALVKQLAELSEAEGVDEKTKAEYGKHMQTVNEGLQVLDEEVKAYEGADMQYRVRIAVQASKEGGRDVSRGIKYAKDAVTFEAPLSKIEEAIAGATNDKYAEAFVKELVGEAREGAYTGMIGNKAYTQAVTKMGTIKVGKKLAAIDDVAKGDYEVLTADETVKKGNVLVSLEPLGVKPEGYGPAPKAEAKKE